MRDEAHSQALSDLRDAVSRLVEYGVTEEEIYDEVEETAREITNPSTPHKGGGPKKLKSKGD